MMDFSWTDEQQAQRERVIEFARDSLGDDVKARDAQAEFSRTAWRAAAEFGVLAWPVPQAHGGQGQTLLTTAYLMEALGYGCRDNGLCFGLGTQMWGVQPSLLRFGSGAQIRRYLPAMLAGDLIGAFAINEDASGSDAFGIETTAVADGDGYVLDGEKSLISFAPECDFAVVFAKTRPDAGRWGVSAFLVDAASAGFTAHPAEPWMGLRTVPAGRITLEACRVPADALLAREGSGAGIFEHCQSLERSLMLAPHLGMMQRQLDDTIARARTRRRGGTPIGKHQAVAHRIVEMKLRLETARLLLYRAVWMLDRGERNPMEAALTKLHLGESVTRSSLDALTVFGGGGYEVVGDVERDLRDAIGGTLHSGTSDIQRNIVSGLLGL